MISWFMRRRKGAPLPPEIQRAHAESVARLEDAKELRADAAQVSSSLRERVARNHFAEGFRVAMGGPA